MVDCALMPDLSTYDHHDEFCKMTNDDLMSDNPDSFDGPEDGLEDSGVLKFPEPAPEIEAPIVYPIRRKAEIAIVLQGLKSIRQLMERAQKINDDLALMIAEDAGIAVEPGAYLIFEREPETEALTLVIRKALPE